MTRRRNNDCLLTQVATLTDVAGREVQPPAPVSGRKDVAAQHPFAFRVKRCVVPPELL
jgi:hypothetical protein